MNEIRISRQCINCGRTLDEVPLIPLLQRDGQAHICPQCIPLLIHQPQVFIGKLTGAESLQPAEHQG